MAEPDPEIQDLLERSAGINVGLDYLPGSLALGAPEGSGVTPNLAADVIWFDALLCNVDRTPRNPNLLLWHRRLYLIDHGAALYTQHGWRDDLESHRRQCRRPLPSYTRPRPPPHRRVDHGRGSSVWRRASRRKLLPRRSPRSLTRCWKGYHRSGRLKRHRRAYATYLTHRLAAPRAWVAEAEEARHAQS